MLAGTTYLFDILFDIKESTLSWICFPNISTSHLPKYHAMIPMGSLQYHRSLPQINNLQQLELYMESVNKKTYNKLSRIKFNDYHVMCFC